jgi:HAD superfamily hydrolase (TIGR01662 family)
VPRDLDDGSDDLQVAPVEVDRVVAEPDGLAPPEPGSTGHGDEPAVPLHDSRNELLAERLTLDDLSLRAGGHTVTIVSNNSEQAIHAFIEGHALAEQIDGVVGRTRARAQDLKPEPYLLDRALEQLGAKPADAVLVGDSITDIQAARAAGTAAIAYANKPGKDRALRSFEPDALIKSMDEIAHAA